MAAVLFVLPQIHLFLTIIVGFVVYAIGLVLLGGFERKDINILKEILFGQKGKTPPSDAPIDLEVMMSR
jgi:hypothetical protein